MEKLRVGITQGDANGVGPEIIIKALAPEGMLDLITPVIFANKGVILANMQHLKGENFRFQAVASAADARHGKMNLVNVGQTNLTPQFGQPTAESGRSAYEALEAAVAALEAGDIDVLVTAPINKAAIQSDEFHFPGHTEYLEARFAESEVTESESEDVEVVANEAEDNGVADTLDADSDTAEVEEEIEVGKEPETEEEDNSDAVTESTEAEELFGELPSKAQMILFNDDLRVALLTTHLPLAEVSQQITVPKIVEAVRRFDATLRRDFGCDRPRIAVLSLNPHAGDAGLLGHEEKDVIMPALQLLRQHGVLSFGPYAADGFFGSGEWRKFDGVLAMYHDQGLAPFKTIAGSEGVNFTSGLEYIRTSPDHGTAYDIAGKMQADAASMRNAIYKAVDIYRRRERYDEMVANPLKIAEIQKH